MQYAFKISMSHESAIHITYRISLRSSSMQEPRDPLLKVVLVFIIQSILLAEIQSNQFGIEIKNTKYTPIPPKREERQFTENESSLLKKRPPNQIHNDPSAGSPTETLLRLLLPLNDQV